MRITLAITVALVAALPAAAQTAGDRYGPRRAEATQQIRFEGRTLSWANKTLPTEAAPAAPQIDNRPQPMALAAQYTRGQILPPPPGPYREPVAAPAYEPFQPQIPLPAQMKQRMPARAVARPAPVQAAPQAQALPANIYDSAAAGPAPTDPVLAGGPPPRQPLVQPQAQPQPQQLAAVAPPQAARTVGGATRYYSLHRGYGLAPDAIPEPPAGNRYILVGPSEDGVGNLSKSDDDDPDDRPGAF